ncbi:M48 family metallopeptidase [Brachyspira innocens]|uniref:tetratricopeptide repeat protein n=1 Tax=Brachyspira innocens TaxID=13264 RepID=UPI0026F12673|nr:tetratricopeptide repeat protein [Brachyspira innocens]
MNNINYFFRKHIEKCQKELHDFETNKSKDVREDLRVKTRKYIDEANNFFNSINAESYSDFEGFNKKIKNLNDELNRIMQFSADISSLVYVMPDVSIDDYYTYTDFISYFNCDDKSFNNFDDIHIQQLKRFDKLLEKTDDDFELYKERGDLKSEMGLYDEAVKDYEKALELNPNYEEAKNAIEKIKNDKINLLKGENLLKIKAVSHLLKLTENEIFNNGKSITGKYLKLKEITDNISNFSDNLTEFDKVMEEFINEVINNNIKFGSKEANKIIQNIYENYINIININIDDPSIKLVHSLDKEFYESLNNEMMLKFVDLVAPIYEEGLVQFIYGEPKSSKTSVLYYKIMHIVKNRKKKAAVVLLNERHADAKKYASISQDCEVYSLAWDNPDLIGVSKTQKFELFNKIFERITADPTINYIIIDSLSRLYELLENVGIGEDEDTKEGGQKYTCRDYIRDNYICKINQYNKSMIATLLLEGKNSLNTKVAKYLKGLGNSDVELSAYLLSKGLFPPVNKNSSSTRDILSLLNEKDFLEGYKSFIRWYEKEFRADKADFEKALTYTSYPYEIKDGYTVINLDNSPLSKNFEFRSLLD